MMCTEQKSQIFRPWDLKSEPSAFHPIEDKLRSHSVSSDTTSSSSSSSVNPLELTMRPHSASSYMFSGFSPTSARRSSSVSSETSNSSLASLKNFVDEKSRSDGFVFDQTAWMNTAAPTCMPVCHPVYNAQMGNAQFALLSHVHEAVHRLKQQDAAVKQMKKLRPKRFRCSYCKSAFSNNGQLKGHLRIHTGEKPFVCDEEGCGKSFTRNEELTRHKKIHSGERPHLCQVCHKGFGRKDHLKKHSRTHEARVPQPNYLSAEEIAYATAHYYNPLVMYHPAALAYPVV